MTRDRANALRAARNQAQYLSKLRTGAGKESDPEKRRLYDIRIRREERRMQPLEKAACKAMDGMTPELYAFCMAYYIDGQTLRETAALIDRSMRQCQRYMLIVERNTEQTTGQKEQETHEQKV